MGIFGLAWELAVQPVLVWLSRKWVRFVLRKRSWWLPGTPFPRYFGEIRLAVLHTPTHPGRVLRSLSPVRRVRESRYQMVPGPRG